jgi:hypothetical protein
LGSREQQKRAIRRPSISRRLNEIGAAGIPGTTAADQARQASAPAAAPATILCPHENTAVHMAAGYAIATARPGVMVHVDAGTNSAMALHTLPRGCR